jgi:ribose 1,5-bisphosphokinase PhnN
MDTLAERLDSKLREWTSETAEDVRRRIAEIMDLADQDVLDIGRSREFEQAVLDMVDDSSSR